MARGALHRKGPRPQDSETMNLFLLGARAFPSGIKRYRQVTPAKWVYVVVTEILTVLAQLHRNYTFAPKKEKPASN